MVFEDEALEIDFVLPEESRWTPVVGPFKGRGGRKYLCRCSCGTERTVSVQSLVSGRSLSCGCLRRDRMLEASRLIREKEFKESYAGDRADLSKYLWDGLDLKRFAVVSIIPMNEARKEAVIVMFDRLTPPYPVPKRWCLEYLGQGHYFATYEEMRDYFERRFEMAMEPMPDAGTTIVANKNRGGDRK